MYSKTDQHTFSVALFFFSTILVLLCVGIIFIYSASSVYALERLGTASYFATKHMFGIVIGIMSMLIMLVIPLDFIKKMVPYVFLCTIGMTLATQIPYIAQTVHGSSRWLKLGFCTIQPSELLKYSFIVYLAYFFEKKAYEQATIMHTYIPFLCILLIVSITLLLQPDFGMTVTLCMTGLMVAFIAGVKTKHVAATLLLLVPITLLLIYLKPYRVRRILTFLNPWADPKGAGFQIIQSFIAIGSGSLWGLGVGQSKQKFFYLPMQHTDFIFSIIAEEIGFIGALLIILFFILFLYAGLRLALMQTDLFARYTITGFVIVLSLQALINIAVTTGLVPTKGIGLPFISYGNSSLVSTFAMIGLIVRMIKHDH